MARPVPSSIAGSRAVRAVALVAILCLALLLPGERLLRFQAGVPRHVETVNPKMGMHTRLTDEVEETKIARTAQMVREMGAIWMVEYFPWAYMEPAKGRYTFGHAEAVIEHAYDQGLQVIARLDMVPDWARPKGSTSRYLDASHYSDFGDFVFAFVDHFKTRVRYYIIWNEPNVAAEWGFRDVSPEDYVALLRVAYTRAKEADPSAVILAAGLAPTLEENGATAMNDLLYLQRMYDAGAAPYFDALAIHAYGGRFPPDDAAAPDRLNFARAELVRQVMVRNGDAGKPAFITEAGWNDHPHWTRAVRPAQRITYSIRAYQKALEDWPWCQALALWAFRYPRPAAGYQNYYTFVQPDFTPRPIYVEIQRYAQGRK
jgi:hypothetical protein